MTRQRTGARPALPVVGASGGRTVQPTIQGAPTVRPGLHNTVNSLPPESARQSQVRRNILARAVLLAIDKNIPIALISSPCTFAETVSTTSISTKFTDTISTQRGHLDTFAPATTAWPAPSWKSPSQGGPQSSIGLGSEKTVTSQHAPLRLPGLLEADSFPALPTMVAKLSPPRTPRDSPPLLPKLPSPEGSQSSQTTPRMWSQLHAQKTAEQAQQQQANTEATSATAATGALDLKQTESQTSNATMPTDHFEDDATTDEMATPSSTAPSSCRAPSPLTFENFPSRVYDAKDEYVQRGKLYTKTRQMMRSNNGRVSVVASRGYQREAHVPTQRTQPALLKRRYSVDVNTTDDYPRKSRRLSYKSIAKVSTSSNSASDQPASPTAPKHQANTDTFQSDDEHKYAFENEPPVKKVATLDCPNPLRYKELAHARARAPPHNDKIYLELGATTIRNDSWNYMAVTDNSCGSEVWMRGESLDMALEVLRLKQQCDVNAIDIANSDTSQVFYFANMCNDGATSTYDQYRARFQGKRWIFIPINDGIGGSINEDHSGSHWTLVAMDLMKQTAHYFDSLTRHRPNYEGMAKDIAQGVVNILGLNSWQWTFVVEHNCPNQWRNNLFKHDGGPCAPFVFRMTEMLVEHIRNHQDYGLEDQCSLELPAGFEDDFGNHFHSREIRYRMQRDILEFKVDAEARALIEQHDAAAMRDAEVTFVVEDGLPEQSHRQTVQPATHQRYFPRHRGRHRAQAPTPSPSPSPSGSSSPEPELVPAPKSEVAESESEAESAEEENTTDEVDEQALSDSDTDPVEEIVLEDEASEHEEYLGDYEGPVQEPDDDAESDELSDEDATETGDEFDESATDDDSLHPTPYAPPAPHGSDAEGEDASDDEDEDTHAVKGAT